MTTKTKLSATLPTGEIVTRTTARDYKYVVAAREDMFVTAKGHEGEIRHQEEQIAEYEATAAYLDQHPELVSDGFVPHVSLPVELRKLLGAPGNASRTTIVFSPAKYREWIVGCNDRIATLRTQIETIHAGDLYGPWYVYQWTSRRELAEKARAQAFLRGNGAVIVIEVNA